MFINRRKTIHNNLSSFLGDKNLSMNILSAVQIEPNRRPEDISPKEFVSIYEEVKKY